MINVPRATQFMEHVGQWIGYIAAFVTLVHLPLQISRWRAVLRLYGRIPWSLVRQIGVYSLRNKMLRLQLGSLSVMLLIFVVPITVNFVGADILGMLHPFGAVARSQELPALLVFAWQLERVIGYLVPPAGLLLGTAKSVNVHLVAVLNRKVHPFRVVLCWLSLKWRGDVFR